MDLSLVLKTFMLLTPATLSAPILFPLLSSNLKNTPAIITSTAKTSFLISLIPMTIYIYSGTESLTTMWEWKYIINFKIPISLKTDFYLLTLFPIALLVSWSVLQFTTWYMASDPYITKFFTCFLFFLMAMLILIIASNLLVLFIGWEGLESYPSYELADDMDEQKRTPPPSKPYSTIESEPLGLSSAQHD